MQNSCVRPVSFYGVRLRLIGPASLPRRTAPSSQTNEQQDARLPLRLGPSWKEIDDPAKDGWDTEQFHAKAKKQLAVLGNLLANPSEIDASGMADLITEGFGRGPLLSGDLTTAYEAQHLKIERGSTAATSVQQPKLLLDRNLAATPKLHAGAADVCLHRFIRWTKSQQ